MKETMQAEKTEITLTDKVAAVITVVATVMAIRRGVAMVRNLLAITSAMAAAMEDRRVDRAKIRAVRLRSFRKVR